jgi:ubiquinone/menaquinone biosynthesis C-methylase UbiE
VNIEQIEKRFSQIAKEYDEQRKLFIPCFDDYYGLSVSFLKKTRNDIRKILDLGAGTGLLTKRLYDEYPNANYTLVDISEQMLAVARQRFSGLKNFNYSILDYSTDLPCGKFDLIASALSFHHVENADKLQLYSNIYDKLKDGGCLLNLDQFNASSDEMNEKYNNYWYEYINTSGIALDNKGAWLKRRELDRENTIDETKQLLTKVGFRNVECIYNYLKFGVIYAEK